MKKKILFSIIVCLLSISLGQSCLGNSYRVGPGDILRITVYDNDDLRTNVRVDDSGTIIMPLVGRIKVADMTIPQVSDLITKKLADGYIVNPQVNVFIEEFRSKKVVILGHIKRPGLVELSGSISLLELISKAGGLTIEAGNTATIKRNKKSQDENDVIVIDLTALIEKGDLSQDKQIFDGDTVYISKAGMCFITGQVKSPGAYACTGKTTILKLVAIAGGFTGKASRSGVKIVRKEGDENKVYKDIELDTPLQVDDVVIVPESFF